MHPGLEFVSALPLTLQLFFEKFSQNYDHHIVNGSKESEKVFENL